MKQHIKIKITNFDIICEYQNCWIDLDGNIIKVDNQKDFELKAIELIDSFELEQKQSFSKCLINNESIFDWFVNQGFIAIKDSKAYYSTEIFKPSEEQCNIISCILINDKLIDKNSILGKKYLKQKSKQEYGFKQKYYDVMLPHAKEKLSPILTK